MITALIDQNIISYGDILLPMKMEGIIGYRRKTPLGTSGKPIRDEFNCLPAIAKLLAEQKISLFRYIELDLEDWKRSGSGISSKLGSLFPNNIMKQIPPAVERSYFFQSPLNEYLKKETVIEFCHWLNKLDIRKLTIDSSIMKSLPDGMSKNIKNIDRYQELCKGLTKEQCIDALHLWSAECSNVDYFLTMDMKFINAMRNNKTNKLCKPILPSELLCLLGESETVPFSFEENVFYGISGEPIFELT